MEQTKNTSTLIIHALVVRAKEGMGVVNLTGLYDLAIIDKKDVLVSRAAQRSVWLGRIKIATFNTLYGENGTGKTQILFDICDTFAATHSGERCGVLFEDSGRLSFYKGSLLGGSTVKAAENLQLSFSRRPPSSECVFYTTSPYEHLRRQRLSRTIHDLTSRFDGAPAFDALTLVERFSDLRKWGAFVNDMEVTVSVAIPSAETVVDSLEVALRESIDQPGEEPLFDRRNTRAQFRNLLLEWLKALPVEKRNVALIQFSRSSELADRQFLRPLLSAIRLSRDLPSTPDKAAEDVYQLIAQQRLNPRRQEDWAQAEEIAKYLDETLEMSATRRKRKRTAISTLGKTLKLNQERARAIAQLAQRHGFLRCEVHGLSSGQAAFLMLYTSLGSVLRQLEHGESRPVFILIDEGEMFMHPSWQRKYIADIAGFIANFAGLTERVHVVLATHSLIVAADSPPNSLLDVKSGETKNGFGLGPMSILEDIYGVERFTGENSKHWIEDLVKFLKDEPSEVNADNIGDIASQLADEDLREVIFNKINARWQTRA